MYKIRAILDTKEDVIRTITVNNTVNLEDLHSAIAASFGFNGQEMASFYKTDDEWNQGDEIPLFDMSELGEELSMKSFILQETLPKVNHKLIYVYDFLNLWTFYVEVIEITDEKISEPKILLAVGEIPEEPIDKEFIAENNTDDDFSDNDFESLDDIDFDQY